ncbi:lysine histidine transporter-like 8 [Durio zibethinus]|uniref:Lysine histidine transporter-like 8 n=1 Tax=Durio zibethinus TaxID=66656 RepID=A0A6P5YJV5_DURZI|nr:lysine histidine transporter-like 8 [Durio zibethinus]
MSEANDNNSSVPWTPRPATVEPQLPVSYPPSRLHSPFFSGSPLPSPDHVEPPKSRFCKIPAMPAPKLIAPFGNPLKKVLRLTKLDPEDSWLPITESRNGNKYYAAFHTLCSGIGIQALILPVAFTYLGWAWGLISLTLAFIWQFYTLWILVQLHESSENGKRYSRYVQLADAAFGDRLGKVLALFPIGYLSSGTCGALIMIGGSTLKIFYQIVCKTTCTLKPLTTVEWCLVFTCAAVLLSLLPNLNSMAVVSLVGAITGIGYCTLIWVVSVAAGRLPEASYNTLGGNTEIRRIGGVLNALGTVAFAFRGHNLILEIQGTVPSSEKRPSQVPMWQGVKVAYTIIAMCLFPLAIGGYWAYGHKIPANNGMLTAFYQFHSRNVSPFVLGLTSLFIVINSLCSFQIYGMPSFDDMELLYTGTKKKRCPCWLRALFRIVFGFFSFFIVVAVPFSASVSGVAGGIALPVTLAYPCFMWAKIKKPKKYGGMWWLNWGLGILGMGFSFALVAAGIPVICT